MKTIALTLAILATCATLAQQPLKSQAPELTGSKWLNTTEGKAVTLGSRTGKVTVVHFWTFACSNCQANFAAYDRLYRRYANRDVEFVGVHTPELEIERSDANVAQAVKRHKIQFPVLIDTDGKNWMTWKQRYWPTVYVIDKQGKVTFLWEGELAYRGAKGEALLSDAIAKALKS